MPNMAAKAGHGSSVLCLAAARVYSNEYLVTGSADRTLGVWNLSTGHRTFELKGHVGSVECLDVLGDCAVSGGADGTIRCWCIRRGIPTRLFKAHGGFLSFISIIDPERILSVSSDGQLRVWRFAASRKKKDLSPSSKHHGSKSSSGCAGFRGVKGVSNSESLRHGQVQQRHNQAGNVPDSSLRKRQRLLPTNQTTVPA